MIGMPSLNLYANENDRANMIAELRKTEKIKDKVYPAKRKNGTTFWISMNVQFLKNSDGKIIGTEGLVRDITIRKEMETKLIVSETRFKAISEQATDGITLANTNGKYIFVNQSFCKMVGYSEEELLKMTVFDLKVPNDETILFNSVVNNKSKSINRKKLLCKDKTIIYTDINGKVIKINDEDLVLGMVRDVTKQVEIEDNLIQAKELAEENEKQFSQLFENMEQGFALHEMIYDTDGNPNDYRFILTNKAFNILTRNFDFDLRGKTVKEIMPNTERVWIDNYGKVAKTGIPFSFENYSAELDKYYSVIAYSPKINFFAVVFTDVTKNKKYEEEIIASKEKAEESENRLKLATKSGKLGIWDWNVKENTMHWDDRMFELYGITREKFPNSLEAWTSGLHPDDKQRAIDECYIALKGGKDFDTSFRVVHPNGEILYLKADAIVLRDGECNPLRMIGINKDITESKLSEDQLFKAKVKAEESDRLKTAFLQNMSHEIRTPMNAIMGFSELLVRNYNDKSKLEHFSKIINQRCSDLLVIIDDILDIAKIESGQLTVNNENCNLNALFAELKLFFEEHQTRLGKQHIKFTLQANCDKKKLIIETDKIKLKQILINLIGNAFKYTDHGQIDGGCKLDNNNIIFYVSDTGIGIAQEKQQMIFERFTQIEPIPNRLFGGTGLGLSIVKGLVELLKGKIWLDSKLGKGTTFYFSLPYKSANTIEQEPLSKEEKNYEYSLKNKTMLIVEDDPYNISFIKEILSETGINLLFANYGKDAIQIATSKPLDLILMDINLPDITGYDATLIIRQQNPNIKIIAQTAYAASEDKQKALNAGCIDYISKPLKSNMLISLIIKHII
jgi:PAS domain S-box-containing protein